MSLATSVDNKPWACQLHFAYDDELNLYFCSNTATRHCTEIAKNPHVAGAISTQHEPGEKPRCVDFEGVAEMVTDITEDHPAYKAYNGRFPGRVSVVDYLKPENGGRIYKISVSDYFMFDARESKPAQKYHLAWPAK